MVPEDVRCTGTINRIFQRPPRPCWNCTLRTTPSPDQPRIALINPVARFVGHTWVCASRVPPATETAGQG